MSNLVLILLGLSSITALSILLLVSWFSSFYSKGLRDSAPPPLRVLFIHGLESSSRGRKSVYLQQHFDCLTPKMNPLNPISAFFTQMRAIREFKPHVIVGSSYGGGILHFLIQSGQWKGPSVLLAPATGALFADRLW